MKRRDQIEEIFASIIRFKRALHGLQVACPGATVSGSQISLLFAIKRLQPTTVTKLAKIMQMTPGAVSQALESLESTGYIARRAATDDRRIVGLTLTNQGEIGVAHINSMRSRLIENALADCTDQEIATVIRLHDKIFKSLENQNEVKITERK